MKSIAAILLMIFGMCFAVIMSILVMINGWGLEPKSYGWIIGISMASQFFAQLVLKVAEKIAKEK